MTSVTDLREMVEVVIGVDTHVYKHVAAAVDARTGAQLDTVTVSADDDGYATVLAFADRHSPARFFAIEGTGIHGAGLARFLMDEQRGEIVVELDRPERAKRRHGAKTDEIDAVRAAHEALARPRLGTPRCGGDRDALSTLLSVRRSAVDGAADGARQLFNLAIAAPDVLRERLGVETDTAHIVSRAAKLRVRNEGDPQTTTIAAALRQLAKRIQTLRAEADDLEKQIKQIVAAWRPDLLDVFGVGPITAAVVLCAWSHPGRINSRAAFAMLAGAAPIPANSGQTTTRYRLNRSGDRQLNRALHTIAVCRMRYDDNTRRYVERRASKHGGNKTRPEIRRCLKTYIARQLFTLLENPKHNTQTHPETPAQAA